MALVDTGSCVNVISLHLYLSQSPKHQESDIEKVQSSILAFNGEEVPILGKVKVHFHLMAENQRDSLFFIDVECFVTSLPNEFIIGSQFLMERNALIGWSYGKNGKKEVTISMSIPSRRVLTDISYARGDGRREWCEPKQERKRKYSLYLKEDLLAIPGHTMMVTLKGELFPLARKGKKKTMIASIEDDCFYHLTSLVKFNSQHEISLPITPKRSNPHPVRLLKGWIVGYFRLPTSSEKEDIDAQDPPIQDQLAEINERMTDYPSDTRRVGSRAESEENLNDCFCCMKKPMHSIFMFTINDLGLSNFPGIDILGESNIPTIEAFHLAHQNIYIKNDTQYGRDFSYRELINLRKTLKNNLIDEIIWVISGDESMIWVDEIVCLLTDEEGLIKVKVWFSIVRNCGTHSLWNVPTTNKFIFRFSLYEDQKYLETRNIRRYVIYRKSFYGTDQKGKEFEMEHYWEEVPELGNRRIPVFHLKLFPKEIHWAGKKLSKAIRRFIAEPIRANRLLKEVCFQLPDEAGDKEYLRTTLRSSLLSELRHITFPIKNWKSKGYSPVDSFMIETMDLTAALPKLSEEEYVDMESMVTDFEAKVEPSSEIKA